MIPETVTCSQCWGGSYREKQPGSAAFFCTDCGHEVTMSDMGKQEDVSGSLGVSADGTLVAYYSEADF